MLFNSPEYAVFLLAVLLAYAAVRLVDGRTGVGVRLLLLVCSYGFYMSWNPAFGLLLLFSTLLDFGLALRLEASRNGAERRWLVAASCLGNLGLLGFFKYGSFAWSALSPLLGVAYRRGDVPWLDVALPVGISFYTFQTLSYTIDVYRRQQAASRSLLDFALYVSFFPQLVAGPIVRAGQLLPQLARLGAPRADQIESGIARIAVGLVKKIVFADGLGALVDQVHADPASQVAATAALAVYAYAFQIYFDFSGYTDIAIGTARLFGVELPENFDRPYRSASLREFWRRWHITLSTWLRDYLYIPLGGNRLGGGRTLVNLFATMVLGGLWHGAAWTFVLWGAYHGALLAGERLARARGLGAALPLWVRRVVTFHAVALGFTLFRATSLAAFVEMLEALGRPGAWPRDPIALHALLLLAIAAGVHLSTGASFVRERLVRLPTWAQGVSYAAAAVVIFLSAPTTARFIYFQF